MNILQLLNINIFRSEGVSLLAGVFKILYITLAFLPPIIFVGNVILYRIL